MSCKLYANAAAPLLVAAAGCMNEGLKGHAPHRIVRVRLLTLTLSEKLLLYHSERISLPYGKDVAFVQLMETLSNKVIKTHLRVIITV